MSLPASDLKDLQAALGYGSAMGGIKIFVEKEFYIETVNAFLEDQIISEADANAALEGWV